MLMMGDADDNNFIINDPNYCDIHYSLVIISEHNTEQDAVNRVDTVLLNSSCQNIFFSRVLDWPVEEETQVWNPYNLYVIELDEMLTDMLTLIILQSQFESSALDSEYTVPQKVDQVQC